MADNDNPTPDQQDTSAGTPAPDASPGQQVDWQQKAETLQTELEQFKSRYSGQQAVLQEAQEKRNALASEMDEMKATVDRLSHELEQATSGRSELEQELQSVQAEAATLAAQQQKMDLVREKYPDLLRFPLETLPDAEDPDDLDAALGQFNEAVSSIVEEQKAQLKTLLSEGAVPTPPAAQSQGNGLGETLEDAMAKLSDLAGTDEFDDALARYEKMLSQDPADDRYRVGDDSLDGDLDSGALGTL